MKYQVNRFWMTHIQRSSITWQFLMGLNKPQFIKHKRIFGIFGASHIWDILEWTESRNLNTFFPMINKQNIGHDINQFIYQ